ncbi:nuclear transport factor 2 family protein [Chryseobacterium caseinilyticum]|uniref:Nuclear transport factor 2 family protein n=1 Tax=Chryseobacterium caseinilyticum TaxID=2771428 RepID=A0ABR8Z9Z6_9FLAO|nr:nuclear transport factor 2 family protein [Chryseobacterium caseinilyticum]MBD8082051.1 nuclear transport factor 2 family protein [Chryseobacterium caseinilyticum]
MKIIFALTLFLGSLSFAQQTSNSEIEKPIRNLFLAMKNADSELLKTVFADAAILQTITKDGVKTENINDFVSSISKMKKDDLDERISIEGIHTDGNLASVFTPYSFYFKGKFSHCGANSFQLVKQNGDWKIQYLIDTRRKDNCKELN